MITTDRPSPAVSRLPLQDSKIPTITLWCYPLHSHHKLCEKHCESHLGFFHIRIQILCTNSGHYVTCDLKNFHLPFYNIILWKRNNGGSKWEHSILRQCQANSRSTVQNCCIILLPAQTQCADCIMYNGTHKHTFMETFLDLKCRM